MNPWPSDDVLLTVPRLRDDGPRVVAIGGGHGLSMVLTAARAYASEIVGVVTVADDGGSSGRLTSALDIPPPGDMRRCLLALCPDDTTLQRIFSYRFTDTDVEGHSMGNLILATLTDLTGDFERALGIAAHLLGAVGSIIPVARTSLHLSARIDGRLVDGQAAIANHHGRIESLHLTPPSVANAHALDAIARADQVVLGPGSLYTSVLSSLIVPGVRQSLDRASGHLVYVLNLTTQEGETTSMSGAEHLQALTEFSGLQRGGTIVAQRTPFRAPHPVEALTITETEAAEMGWKVHHADLLDRDADWPQHHPGALHEALAQLN